jgi:hypothetical protein
MYICIFMSGSLSLRIYKVELLDYAGLVGRLARVRCEVQVEQVRQHLRSRQWIRLASGRVGRLARVRCEVQVT